MASKRGNWESTSTNRQMLVADQLVLGHLLPRFQAAQDWQEIARAELALQGNRCGRKRSMSFRIVVMLREPVSRWRNRSSALPTRTEGQRRTCQVRPRPTSA